MNRRLMMAMVLMAGLASCVTAPKKPLERPHREGQAATTPAPRTSASWQKRHQAMNASAKQGGVDLIFLGDSITQGWEANGKEVWSRHFGAYRPLNLGISGDRTQHVLWRIDNGNLDGIEPKAAVIMIGTNNVDTDSAEDIADGITAIVATLREKRPAMKILLLGVFPRGEKPNSDDSPNLKRVKLHEVNRIISHLADGKQIRYLDIGGKFLEKDKTISKDIMPDFLHLSPRGYEIWADWIDQELKKMMK